MSQASNGGGGGGDGGDGDGDGGGGSDFECETDNVKIIDALLTALVDHKQRDQSAYFEVTKKGMSISVLSKNRCMQATTQLKESLFNEYKCTKELEFRVDLNMMLECLHVFGAQTQTLTQTSLCIHYSPGEATLLFILEEQGVVTQCEIRTIDDPLSGSQKQDFYDSFRECPTVARMILLSECLTDAFVELAEWQGAEQAEIKVRKNSELCMNVRGTHGMLQIAYPKSSQAFVEFNAEKDLVSTYRLALIGTAMRALSSARETCIRLNERGIICIQHMVQSTPEQKSFVDFIILPDEEFNEYE